MKKFVRVCVCFALVAFSFCVLKKVLALDVGEGLSLDKPQLGTMSILTKSTNEIRLSHGLSKKEIIYVLSYDYLNDLIDNAYKYITVQISSIYYNEANNNKILAIASAESNFRCNNFTMESECLSTSKGNISNDSNYVLNVFVRKANETTEKGAGVVEITLKYRGRTYDEKTYNVSCNFNGNVSY